MRVIGALAILAATLATTAASPAMAEPVDRLFSQRQLALLEPGATVTYRHVRQIHAAGEARQGFDEVIRVDREAANAPVLVTMNATSTPRQLDPFRGMTGNPVLMVFLESMVREVSAVTGGSPFYLRNRIREAMRERMTEHAIAVSHAGSEVAAWELKLRPFEIDPHVAELGAFANLRLSFILSDAVPGAFLSLAATTGGEQPVYSEEIRLDETP